jgi:hypothetical protein
MRAARSDATIVLAMDSAASNPVRAQPCEAVPGRGIPPPPIWRR